jgi:hypothetical protein
MAYVSANVANVTGDSTNWTVTYNTEVIDQGGDYNNGAYTFTSPITGVYFLTTCVEGKNLVSGTNTTNFVSIMTSNRTYFGLISSASAVSTSNATFGYLVNSLCDMDAGDTAYCTFFSAGGTKVVGVMGGNTLTFFSGSLIC